MKSLPVSRSVKPAFEGTEEFSKEAYLLDFNPQFPKLICSSHFFLLNP